MESTLLCWKLGWHLSPSRTPPLLSFSMSSLKVHEPSSRVSFLSPLWTKETRKSWTQVESSLAVPSPVLRFWYHHLIGVPATFFELSLSPRGTFRTIKSVYPFIDLWPLLKMTFRTFWWSFKDPIYMMTLTFSRQRLTLGSWWTSSSQSPCHLFNFVLDPEFFFPSLWVPPLHWSSSESCLANRTGFSDYNSVISIPGKTCTGRTALGGDFPALGTLLFEASPHRFKLTFLSQLFEIQLPVIWLCPDFNSSLYHLSQVPITSTQPSSAFCY